LDFWFLTNLVQKLRWIHCSQGEKSLFNCVRLLFLTFDPGINANQLREVCCN